MHSAVIRSNAVYNRLLMSCKREILCEYFVESVMFLEVHVLQVDIYPKFK